ncbi:MAG: hypothetical protein ACYCZB_17360 [Acidiphilium sp.]
MKRKCSLTEEQMAALRVQSDYEITSSLKLQAQLAKRIAVELNDMRPDRRIYAREIETALAAAAVHLAVFIMEM